MRHQSRRRSFRRAAAVLPLVLTAAGLSMLPAAPAHALPGRALVSWDAGTGVFTFTGKGDVADDVIFDAAANVTFTIVDNAALLDMDAQAGDVCERSKPNALLCTPPGLTAIHADLGNGDDRVELLWPKVRAVVWGRAGDDTILGSEADDSLDGGPGNDTLRGYDGDDQITGDAGNDTIHGDQDDDRIWGDDGKDTIYGDADDDKIWDSGYDGDVLRGGPGDDYIEAPAAYLYGDGGNDTIRGGTDVYGGEGDDTVHPGASNDYFGGPGTDTVSYAYSGSGQRISLDNKANERFLPVCESGPLPWEWDCPVVGLYNVHDDFEIVIGSPKNDEITGSDKVDDLRGGLGNDKIWGRGGNDTLNAQGGTDQHLSGDDGVDTCLGSGTLSYTSCEVH